MARPEGEHEETRTTRQSISETLTAYGPLTAKDLSGMLGVSEKEVLDHLEHIRRSSRRGSYRLHIMPAECRKCGFVFETRTRFSKPGKCPQCRSTYIREPEFAMEAKGRGTPE